MDGEPSQAGNEGHDGDGSALDFAAEGNAAMLGVHVVTDLDPDAAAQRIAAEGDVELITDRKHAEAAFAARAEAGRTAVVVIGERERAELEAAAAPGSGPTATPDAVAEIRQSADELRRIERIRQRTEDRFTESLNARLSAESGLALHPDTLRTAGQAVVDVEAEIDRLTRELRELDDQIEASTPAPETTANETTSSPKPRANRIAAIIVAVVALVAAGIITATGVAPAIAAMVAIVGLLVALLLGRRGSRGDDTSDVTAATTPRPTAAEQQSRMVARAQLETGLERARERHRTAQRHWASLAGPDADAHDVEGVLRLRDPQYVVGSTAAQSSPTMRTVNTVHRRAVTRWRAAWKAVGVDDAPTLAEADDALGALASRPSADPDEARQRLAAADAWTAAGATIDRTLVLVEPAQWLPADDLAGLMAKLPAGAEVILVERGS